MKRNKVSISDALLALGLSGLGIGLYLKFGVGISLSAVGGILIILGFLTVPKA